MHTVSPAKDVLAELEAGRLTGTGWMDRVDFDLFPHRSGESC